MAGPVDKVIRNATLATMVPGGAPYGLVRDGAIIVRDGQIAWAGPAADMPDAGDATIRDLGGRLVTPALIDCHTHLVHGGNRAREFEMRLEGASYEEIARAGGGIVSTVAATRAADEDSLLASALRRVDALIAEGVGVVEIKSGYGLDADTELRMLRVARRIARDRPVRVRTSFLGAHAVPAGMEADAYIDDICIPALRRAHADGLADAVDGFCEGIAFSPEQIARVFDVAVELGLPVKLHAEQLSDLGGAKLAASHGALSADHLEYLGADGIAAMAKAGTVAVILPGAFYTLRETQAPPIAALRAAGVPMAVATDANPGSSPMASLLLAMNMACTLFRMTPEEALAGTTRNAARALGLDDCGTIAPGLRADFAVWDVEEPAELSYRIGFNPLHARAMGGQF
ncbi:MAG: imidazolonepropionase [Roseitalea sp.]|uniref:imidazolonepropionase n=1 Tax=Oceaniradius stylonematis TaxID=2184161 RepID=UPI001B18C1C0|nr:imidazolonepropionase [Roseitalea sp.]MBO6951680.1 imidazolonepropionase [Rhizobiaceae bacterium]MBO6592474.1 imidazolonepropionase [Roseitalea sp.]MBO6598729.1 imidazolonepropionase [Roseitalea sp.]MBO6611175.1 imidazolonepropionase [Roseitalea sp.]